MEGPVAAAAAVAADEAEKDKNYVPGRPFSADAPPGERPFKYVAIQHLKISIIVQRSWPENNSLQWHPAHS
jgi:hypothetical protein